MWWHGRPAEPNLWAGCWPRGRCFWLGTALENHVPDAPYRPPGTAYHLDGRHITDLDGFFCALGEAVNGPGGYFGWGLDALHGCLSGHWGAGGPFMLVWHEAEAARTCLGVTPHTDNRALPCFEELLAFLTGHGIDVRLA
ncbi:barstar family protein [Streptomyces sp. NPDC059786]|uniref:barstar family protein n=1 Tax=Streptomyces sp. NPDC059786 TaxID=3346946 RepID=UPI00364DB4F2